MNVNESKAPANSMATVQRALRLAWYEADRKLSHHAEKRPACPELPTDITTDPIEIERRNKVWSEYVSASRIWHEDWSEALGFRDGFHEACCLAGVPNFTSNLPIAEQKAG